MSIFSLEVISHQTGIPICIVLEKVLTLENKYALNADDLSDVAAKGVLAGRPRPAVAETMAEQLSRGVLPVDIAMELYKCR